MRPRQGRGILSRAMQESSSTEPHAETQGARLRELASFFLRMGTVAFGGPAAHIAMMQQEVVTRRGWLTATEFLDMMAATNFIPGPNSTELAIHIGYRRAGIRGLFLAGTCFILPAALMCGAIAALYVRYGQRPISQSILYGIKPVVIAVVMQALVRLGRSAVKSPLLAVVAAAVVVAVLLGIDELAALFGAGIVMVMVYWVRAPGKHMSTKLPLLAVMPLGISAGSMPAVVATAAATAPAPLWSLFLIFLKIGSVLFGSGYVLLAFLRADVVEKQHWLTSQQLLDAIAVGQVTPGPVFTTATFVGYLAAGTVGAVAATVGIFLPAFFFVAISAPFLPRLRNSKAAGTFLDGLNVASLALMAVVTMQLTREAIVDWLTLALAVGALVLLIWRNVNSAWIVVGGAVIGAGRVWLMRV